MPFLSRLAQWADEKPHEPAVVCGRDVLSWSQLRNAASALLPSPGLEVLREPNGVSFAVRWTAGVAGERECIVLDPSWPQGLADDVIQRVREQQSRASHRSAHDPPIISALVDGPEESSFLIGLTSGTTSVPKGLTRSRRSWRRSFESSTALFGLTSADRVLAPGPLSASLNLYTLSECLWAGATFHTLPTFDVAAVHSEIVHRNITRLVVVPAVLRVLAERGMAGDVDASDISAIVCAGQKLDPRTLEAVHRWAPHADIWEYYGASELSFVTARRHPPGERSPEATTGVGRPIPGVELAILDNTGNHLPDGQSGNICVRSELISDGYVWGDDGLAFTRLGDWATVRDQGYLDGGELHVLGRVQDMINTGGNNVYPHEVEAALTMLPGVSQVVVAGVPHDRRGQRIVAGVVPAHAGLSELQLRAGLEGRLPLPKRPSKYVLLSELPLTDRGKLSRTEFRRWILEGDPRVKHLGPDPTVMVMEPEEPSIPMASRPRRPAPQRRNLGAVQLGEA